MIEEKLMVDSSCSLAYTGIHWGARGFTGASFGLASYVQACVFAANNKIGSAEYLLPLSVGRLTMQNMYILSVKVANGRLLVCS